MLDNGVTRKIIDTGLLEQNNPDRILSSPQERYSFFAKGDYEIAPWIKFVSQAYFARTETRSVSFNTVLLGSTGTDIPYDNNIYTGSAYAPQSANFRVSSVLANGNTNPDFLPGGRYGLNCAPVGGCTNKQVFPVPANVAALLDSRTNPNAPWTANYSLDAFGRRGVNTFNNTFQLQLGFEGSIPGTDFTWDFIASHGETVAKTDLVGLVALERFRTILTSPNYGVNFFALGNNGARYGSTASCTTGLSPFIVNSAFSPIATWPQARTSSSRTASGRTLSRPTCRAGCSSCPTANCASRSAGRTARTRSTSPPTARPSRVPRSTRRPPPSRRRAPRGRPRCARSTARR